jgi:hypothetical protein
VKFSILIRISFELPNLQTPIEMVLIESSWEGEEIFFNWQSLYPPHLGGLPFNVVVYINFMFEIFKDCSKVAWTCPKVHYHKVDTRWLSCSSLILGMSITIFNSSMPTCEKIQGDETHNYAHKHVVASFFQWSNNIQHICHWCPWPHPYYGVSVK